jgi:hypothetical protein
MHNFNRFAQNQENVSPEYQNGEFADEFAQDEMPLNEMQEMELAAELMEVTNDAELGRWVGKLFSKAKGVGRNFLQSPEGQTLGNTFRRSARQLVQGGTRSLTQYLGRNLANRVQDPRLAQDLNNLGQSAGAAWGNKWTNDLNLDVDGDNDQQGYYGDEEIAQEFVRFAADAARRYVNSPYRQEYPAQAQRLAMIQSARRHLPQVMGSGGGNNLPQQGTWQRWKKRYIVLSI